MSSQQIPQKTRKERPTTSCQFVRAALRADGKYDMTVRSHGIRFGVETVLKVKSANGKQNHVCGRQLADRGFPHTTCQMGFSEDTQLKQHIKVVHDLNIYECEYCGRLTAEGSNYDKHKRVCSQGPQTGRVYNCRLCRREFPRSDNCKRHERRCRGARASPAVEAEEAEDSDVTASTSSSAAAPAPEQLPLPPLVAPVSPVPLLPEAGFAVSMADLEKPPMFTAPPVTNQQLYDTEEAPLFEAFEADGVLSLLGGAAEFEAPGPAAPAAVPDNTQEGGVSGQEIGDFLDYSARVASTGRFEPYPATIDPSMLQRSRAPEAEDYFSYRPPIDFDFDFNPVDFDFDFNNDDENNFAQFFSATAA